MFRYMLIVRIVELYALFACKINEKNSIFTAFDVENKCSIDADTRL